MNALFTNHYTEAWAGLGKAMRRPKAILCLSAHWYVPGAAITVNTAP
jgi:4,5-DOPA dioxygenase extradiol